MQCRSATPGDRSDLASGSVLHSAPGYPAFEVRPGQELFLRAAAHLLAGTACTLWDPCCGSECLATALPLLNRDRLRLVTCSDISLLAEGDPVTALLDSLRAMLPDHAVVAICVRTRRVTLDRPVRVLERVRIGHRAAIVVRASDLEGLR